MCKEYFGKKASKAILFSCVLTPGRKLVVPELCQIKAQKRAVACHASLVFACDSDVRISASKENEKHSEVAGDGYAAQTARPTIGAVGVDGAHRHKHLLVGVVIHCNVNISCGAKLLWQLSERFNREVAVMGLMHAKTKK